MVKQQNNTIKKHLKTIIMKIKIDGEEELQCIDKEINSLKIVIAHTSDEQLKKQAEMDLACLEFLKYN